MAKLKVKINESFIFEVNQKNTYLVYKSYDIFQAFVFNNIGSLPLNKLNYLTHKLLHYRYNYQGILNNCEYITKQVIKDWYQNKQLKLNDDIRIKQTKSRVISAHINTFKDFKNDYPEEFI